MSTYTNRSEERRLYYLMKKGVYGHGVFWIGSDLDEGKRMADLASNRDRDDYHNWELRQYAPPDDDTDYLSDGWERDELIYTGIRTQSEKNI